MNKIQAKNEFRNSLLVLMPMIVASTLFIMVVYIFCFYHGYPTEYLWTDPLQITGEHYYNGLMSNIGILFWCSATAICLFTYVIFKNWTYDKNIEYFILASGLLSLLLTLDDFFLLHEIFFPRLLHIKQLVVYLIYAVFASCYLLYFRNEILKAEYWILTIALCFLGTSVLVDVFGHILNFQINILEEGSKFLGILCWFMFFVRYCQMRLGQNY